MNAIKNWYKNHGTKILGTATAFIGGLQTAIIQGWLDVAHWEKQLVAVLVVALGTSTVARGFTNTKNAAPPKE